jgi:tRNA pseudouridine55 synthase
MATSLFHGLLVLDKPVGLSSRAAVDRAWNWFPRGTRIGHTGTLDPLATGVLVLTVGSATRLSVYVQRMDKTYRTTIHLGATSDSDDAEGTITPMPVRRSPDRTDVERLVQEFVGEIEQVPPTFSAIKVAGRRAYNLARRGQEVTLKPRRIRIDCIDVLSYDYPRLDIEVHCGEGTYIRALARDIGERLGCGGYVETLRRTRVGPFRVQDAVKLECDATTVVNRLLPLAAAVSELPKISLESAEAARFRNGQSVTVPDARAGCPHEVGVYDQTDLVGVGREELGQLSPVKVFHGDL